MFEMGRNPSEYATPWKTIKNITQDSLLRTPVTVTP